MMQECIEFLLTHIWHQAGSNVNQPLYLYLEQTVLTEVFLDQDHPACLQLLPLGWNV